MMIVAGLQGQMARDGDSSRLKMVYVTPEKIAASTTFMDILRGLYAKKVTDKWGRETSMIARFVVDEAHWYTFLNSSHMDCIQKEFGC